MPDAYENMPARLAETWLAAFNARLAEGDAVALAALFEDDSHWRDIVAFSWDMETVSGADAIAEKLLTGTRPRGAQTFALDPLRCPPWQVARAGAQVVEAIVTFDTEVGRCEGLLRFRLDGEESGQPARLWSLLTALRHIDGYDEETIREGRQEPAFQRNFHGPNWLDQRQDKAKFTDRDPAVLVVGGGHAGLSAAACLGQLGLDTLVIDREKRIGDNWRLRYHGLKLHNQITSNTMPYLNFPKGWPTYIPKDKIANWLEFYVEAMEINFWTETTLTSARWDEAGGHWVATIETADGGAREMRPRHIVMATSVSGTPKVPDIPSLSNFTGQVLHSSQFGDGQEWRDRKVLVFGTGTSAHDICQDLQGNGANVTMVQRSPTLIINVEPSAQLYDGIYVGEGPSMDDRDLINASIPLPLLKLAHKEITDKVREIDRPLLDGLEKAGFRLDFGENGTGWPLKYRNRGGGYYFNVGCSELIVDGRVKLMQYHDIEHFDANGAVLKDGGRKDAELIVLATGYKGQMHMVEKLFGDDVAGRVEQVWGYGEDTQELTNMWMRTGQRGLWFTGGAFSQCRVYSKYLAVQIKAHELGLV